LGTREGVFEGMLVIIPRVSIASLMFVVVLVAVGIAALRNPSYWGTSAIYSVTLALLIFSTAGVIFRKGESRLHWAGMAFFGWSYLIVAIVSSDLNPPTLITTWLLMEIDNRWPQEDIWNNMKFQSVHGIAPRGPLLFFQMGHSVLALLSGLLGTILVRVFARLEDKQS
jgi:hypothetical protein